MPFQFRVDWPDIVSEISTRPEFQTARVRIEDPALATEDYDIETGETTLTGDPVIYRGRARVIGIRASQSVNGEVSGNSTSLVAVRVQLPRTGTDELGYGENEFGEDEYGQTVEDEFLTTSLRVVKGCVLYVESAPRQEVLETYVFTAVSDFQGSSSASRTFEFAVDLDATRGDDAP